MHAVSRGTRFVPIGQAAAVCITHPAYEHPTSHAWPPVQAFRDEHAEDAHRGLAAEEPDSPHAQHHQAGESVLHWPKPDVWQAQHA